MSSRTLLTAAIATAALACVGVSCTGDNGKDGAVGATGSNGVDGKTGPVGKTGPTGDTGDTGDTGPTGAVGAMGDPGATGAAGAAGEGLLNVSCLSPCHGFTGIVAQWQTSTHYATYLSNAGGDEVATWTGPNTCGNCHAIDAISQRVSGDVGFVGTAGPTDTAHGKLGYIASTPPSAFAEATYAGHSTVAEVHCTTCHDVNANNDPHRTGAPTYVEGTFPLRVAVGANDSTLIEKSAAVGTSAGTPAGNFGVANVCISCHRSRKDVTNYVLATNNLSSTHWGPHEGPQADIYSGKGGYHYLNQPYENSSHQAFKEGCVNCHMPAVAANGNIGNHSFYAQLSACQTAGCHVSTTSFDVIGGMSAMRSNIQELRVALNDAGYLTRAAAPGVDGTYVKLTTTDLKDLNFSLDLTRPDAANTALSADIAGALYNYLLLARGSANGIHNPLYTRQLMFDSYKAIKGPGAAPPTTLLTRPHL